MRHLRDKRDVAVHPHAAAVMRAVIRSAVPLSVVHTPGQRVVDAVGQFDGFVSVENRCTVRIRGERLLLTIGSSWATPLMIVGST